jgi:hypothetical protein
MVRLSSWALIVTLWEMALRDRQVQQVSSLGPLSKWLPDIGQVLGSIEPSAF